MLPQPGEKYDRSLFSQAFRAIDQMFNRLASEKVSKQQELVNAADDAAAATAGVPVGHLYRHGSAVRIRVT